LSISEAAENPANLPASETWGNSDTLTDHFARHGTDFDATSGEDYANQASQFLRDSQEQGLPTKIAANGTIRAYDPESDTFGSYSFDGTTKAFFKPSSG
jgi:pyocin large subunit-like protein